MKHTGVVENGWYGFDAFWHEIDVPGAPLVESIEDDPEHSWGE